MASGGPREGAVSDYDAFADIYDAWAGSAPATREDIPFYVAEAAGATTPVLELGVGAGRVAIPVAQSGKLVVGLDRSPAMLAEGRRRAAAAAVADRIEFVEADMRDFRLGKRFDRIFVPFRSILHLLTADDLVACLRAVRDHLAPGGRLVFNVFEPDPAFMRRNNDRTEFRGEFRHPTTGRRTFLWAHLLFHLPASRLDIRASTEELDERGVVVERRYRCTALRLTTRKEYEAAFAQAGLRPIALYGWFDRRRYTPKAKEMVWVVGLKAGAGGGRRMADGGWRKKGD
jgi:SAM-dependent methyltransferase